MDFPEDCISEHVTVEPGDAGKLAVKHLADAGRDRLYPGEHGARRGQVEGYIREVMEHLNELGTPED